MIADDRGYPYDLFMLECRRVDDVQQRRMLVRKVKNQPS
jgi:hypothetical protein